MTTVSTAETFREKAPLLSKNDLAQIVRGELLDETLAEAARAGWLYGRFADPDQSIDNHRSGRSRDTAVPSSDPDSDELSGLEVYAVMEDWGNQEASTRFGTSHHGLLWRLAAQGVITCLWS